MKKSILFIITTTLFGSILAQDIPSSMVPSIVLNQFNNQFPNAINVEWEMEGDLYNVEFENKINLDYEVWYNDLAEQVRYKEELQITNTPKNILTKIQNEYKNYKIDDIDKLIIDNKISYKVELEQYKSEITLFFNENGTIIH